MRIRSVLAATLFLLAAAAPAVAQQTLAPPGKAGADQYFETVPSGAGNAKPPLGSAAAVHTGAAGISAATARSLSGSKDGRAVGGFAADTAPAKGRAKVAGAKGGSPTSTA